MTAVKVVYRRPWNVALALVTFLVMTVFYLWSSQVLVLTGRGVSLLVVPRFMAAALLMALLFGVLLPLQVYAIRQATSTATQNGGTVAGVLLGASSMTCCAPVLLPSLLSLLGFTGTTILGVNGFLNRFWLPLATVGSIFLVYSLISVIQALELKCAARPQAGTPLSPRGTGQREGASG